MSTDVKDISTVVQSQYNHEKTWYDANAKKVVDTLLIGRDR